MFLLLYQDLEGKEQHMWDWVKSQINDLVVTPDGKLLVVIAQEKKIRLFNIGANKKEFS